MAIFINPVLDKGSFQPATRSFWPRFETVFLGSHLPVMVYISPPGILNHSHLMVILTNPVLDKGCFRHVQVATRKVQTKGSLRSTL